MDSAALTCVKRRIRVDVDVLQLERRNGSILFTIITLLAMAAACERKQRKLQCEGSTRQGAKGQALDL